MIMVRLVLLYSANCLPLSLWAFLRCLASPARLTTDSHSQHTVFTASSIRLLYTRPSALFATRLIENMLLVCRLG